MEWCIVHLFVWKFARWIFNYISIDEPHSCSKYDDTSTTLGLLSFSATLRHQSHQCQYYARAGICLSISTFLYGFICIQLKWNWCLLSINKQYTWIFNVNIFIIIHRGFGNVMSSNANEIYIYNTILCISTTLLMSSIILK